MLRPGSFTRRWPAQRTRPPWKISRPDVEVAWWPLGRCCIHLACIAAQPFDQTSLPSDGLFRMNELCMGISAAPITRGEAPGELSSVVWSCDQLPAGCLSVPPSEMIFMRAASAQSVWSRLWVCMDTEVLISHFHFYVLSAGQGACECMKVQARKHWWACCSHWHGIIFLFTFGILFAAVRVVTCVLARGTKACKVFSRRRSSGARWLLVRSRGKGTPRPRRGHAWPSALPMGKRRLLFSSAQGARLGS